MFFAFCTEAPHIKLAATNTSGCLEENSPKTSEIVSTSVIVCGVRITYILRLLLSFIIFSRIVL